MVEPHLPALSIPQAPEHPQESVPWCLLLTSAECSVQGTRPRPSCPHVRLSLQRKAHLHFAAGTGASTSDARGAPFPPLTWGVSIYRKESQALENNFREILFLIEQINVLKALLRETQDGLHNDSRNADGDSSEAQNTTEITDEVQWGWGSGRGVGLLLVPPPSRPLTGVWLCPLLQFLPDFASFLQSPWSYFVTIALPQRRFCIEISLPTKIKN